VFGHERYVLLFWASWVVAVVQSTFTLKYFAFRSKGRLLPQLGRAYLVYLPAQAISTVILWAGVQFLTSAGLTQNLAARVSQLLAVAITTVFSYIGHKYFTFRLPLEVGEVPPEDMIEGPAAIR
jgi:putative flippase GtrA